jgi:septal ring factor EnvC (AmiA/AmiB activator)
MMKNRSKVVSIFWVLLLSLQFLLLPSICSAEQVYLITETELTTLENNFSSLEQINKSSLEKSEKLQQELEISLNKQEQLEKECYRLESKLLSSLEKSERQEKSLKKAEKSLPPSAPGVLREIGAKINVDHYVTGISYGVSRRIGGKYIGFRGEYDWQDKKTGVWVTYAY